MRVRELMQKDVKTVDLDAAVNDAVVTLTDSHISALPVVDAMGCMVGVISSTDILTSEAEAQDAVEREALFEQMMVRDIMTPRPLTVSPEAEQTLDPVLAAAHDRWMAECDRALGPVSDPNATFFQRWAAVRYLGDRFRDRLELEQALLKCLHPFLTAELKARLAMQVDRLAQLHEDLNQLAQRRGTAREVAHTARELLEALRRWYAEIEFTAGDIRQSDLSGKGTQVLARFRGGVWADSCWIH